MKTRRDLLWQRLAGLCAGAFVLLGYPVLGLPWLAGETPFAAVYLFGVWGGVIAVAAWLAERKGR